jgi:hypothetical protein
MSHELFYTSVSRGLRPGEHGFCTVAVTQGISTTLTAKVESLSGYRHLYSPTDRRAAQNPVLQAHLRLSLDGKTFCLLSRIVDAGLDYSQRTNKFAHHVILDRSELSSAGPAWLLQQPGFMETEWGDRSPRIIPTGRDVPQGEAMPARCRRWEEITGDAGWAGVLASMTAPNRPAYLVFRPGQDPLPLIAEALALIPAAQRWNITFSTYFLGLPPDVPCQWRCILADTPETNAILESPGANVILLDPDQGQAPDSPLVEAARTGRIVPEQAVMARPTRGAIPIAVGVSSPSSESLSPKLTALASPPPILPVGPAMTPEPLAADAPAKAHSGGVLTLALGMVLGLALMFMCILPIELIAGRSLPGFAGIVGKDEEESKNKVANLENSHKVDEEKARGLREEIASLNLQVQKQQKVTQEKVDLESKLKQKSNEADSLKKENLDLIAKAKKAAEENKRPADGQKNPVVPSPPKQIVKEPLELPKREPNARASALPIKTGSKVKLVGLPKIVENLSLESGTTESNDRRIEVTVDKKPFAVFERKDDGQWMFKWEIGDQAWNKAVVALKRSVLKATLANGDTEYYPLQAPEKWQAIGLDRRNDNTNPVFRGELKPPEEGAPIDYRLVPGKIARLDVDFKTQIVPLGRTGLDHRLEGAARLQLQIDNLTVKLTVDKVENWANQKFGIVILKYLEVYRLLEDEQPQPIEFKIADVGVLKP